MNYNIRMLIWNMRTFPSILLAVSFVLPILVPATPCADKSETSRRPEGLKAIPIVLFLVTEGKDVRLPCHYCDEKTGISGRKWQRKDLHGKITTIKLDTHDNEEDNRVFINQDHSLTIRSVSKDDASYYFCYDMESNDTSAKIEMLLDITHRTALEPHVLTSPIDLNKAIPPLLKACDKIKSIKPLSEYRCYTEWVPWSKCSECGKLAKRRRVGECRLQKLIKTKIEAPKGQTVEADFPIVGVGCHSYLLDAIPQAKEILSTIPNVVLTENCEVSCEGYLEAVTEMSAHKFNAFLKKVKMKSLSETKGVKHTMVTEIKKEKEGETVVLFCPGATLDTPVKWLFKNKVIDPKKMKDETNGRINIDATDALHIRELRSTDAGDYICTLYDVEIGLARLSVIPYHMPFDPTSNFGILTISFGLVFILYLGLVAIKWKSYAMQRKAQSMRQARGMVRPLITVSDDSDSD